MVDIDIPDLVGKTVMLKNLNTASFNNQLGFVKGWDKNRELFLVEIFGELKYIKPINLDCYPRPQTPEELNLLESMGSWEILNVDLKTVLKNFNLLESDGPEQYRHTHWKILWIRLFLNTKIGSGDHRYNSKFRAILKKIIDHSKFEDLIVTAKILLAIMFSKESGHIEEMMELLGSCIRKNFGLTPRIFERLAGMPGTPFNILQTLYFASKDMVISKTAAYGSNHWFIFGAVEFFKIWKESRMFRKDLVHEIKFLRHKIESLLVLDFPDFRMQRPYFARALAHVCFWEQNYQDALTNMDRFQKFVSSTHGHGVSCVADSYEFKAKCYIKLGNRKMAQKALKKLKHFKKAGIAGKSTFKTLQIQIQKMTTNPEPDEEIEAKNVRNKVMCSSFSCNKVEPHLRAFKSCSRCRLVYYCSPKCQKIHWKDAHKKKCVKAV